MEKPPVCHGIIPARYGSSRFPGKALTDILGKPMFWHVWHRASLCPQLASVTLATDDERIAGAASALGVPWVMTSKNHESGTDRVYEAARRLDLPTDAVLVNIQGDEPALSPAMLGELVQPFFMDPSVRVTTLARSVGIARTGNADRALSDEINSPDRVKVVFARNGDALYFSRLPIPFERDADSTGSAGRAECICRQDGGIALSRAEGDGCEPETTFSGEATSPTASARTGSAGRAYVHIGLYAFRYEALAAFTALPKSRLEGLEKLEQLRFLENGIPIRVVLTEGSSLGVDRPEDLPEVLRVMGADAS